MIQKTFIGQVIYVCVCYMFLFVFFLCVCVGMCVFGRVGKEVVLLIVILGYLMLFEYLFKISQKS
jgi:hypothetical protein